jgi:hypothetical protein
MKNKCTNYKQGYFTPLIPSRYKGSFPLIYRSSLELKFFRWCDSSSSPVIEWTSESYVIPYQSPLDGKIHRYFCDNSITLKDKTGVEHKYLIEIKPKRKTVPPTESKKKSTSTILFEKCEWVKSRAKWKAAEEYALKKNMRFIILTEEDLIKLN